LEGSASNLKKGNPRECNLLGQGKGFYQKKGGRGWVPGTIFILVPPIATGGARKARAGRKKTRNLNEGKKFSFFEKKKTVKTLSVPHRKKSLETG